MKAILMFVALAVMSACASQPSASSVDRAAEEQAIRGLSSKWLELTKQKDPAGIAALFADDARLIWAGQDPVVGKTAIQEFFTQDFANNPKQATNWETDRVELAASGDLAVEYGHYENTGAGREGTLDERGNYATVYRKVDGAWKVISDSSVPSSVRGAATVPTN
jgi:uncharacterized protein (TIGR02246 family)